MTAVLNGVKVIDYQPIIGPTVGTIYSDPFALGPIYLQGDHTMVRYKNIYLAPVLGVSEARLRPTPAKGILADGRLA